MSFRVTQGMLSRQMMNNLHSNLQQLQRHQEHMSTQRKINRPSDNPVGFNYAMRYRSELRSNEQYQANKEQARSQLEATESLMNSVNEIMQRVNELAIQGANGTNSEAALESNATEVGELLDHLISIGNEKVNGRYVFNGEKTQTQPYDPDQLLNSVVDDGKIVFHIGPGVELEVNVTGDDVFGEIGTDDNLFQILTDLSSALRVGDTEEINQVIARLDQRSDQFLKTLASVGARTRRLELTTTRLLDNHYNMSKLLAEVEGIDIGETVTHMKMAENVYIASLSVSAHLMQPSLLDFLR